MVARRSKNSFALIPEQPGACGAMIKLTRLDGEAFILNAELIRYVERRPDTFITLTTGERFVVAESMDEVVHRAVEYQQRKHLVPCISSGTQATMTGGVQR